MGRPFSLPHLLAWVVLYAAFAAVPWWALSKLSPEHVDKPLRAGQPTTIREAAMWFPSTMAVAAGVTLGVGTTFGLMYAVLGASNRLLAHTNTPREGSRRWTGRSLSPARSACGVFGILLIVGGIVGVWMAIAQDHLDEWIPPIIAAIGGGIGLATGGVYHTRD